MKNHSFGSNRHCFTANLYRKVRQVASRGKPSFLVIFPVVGDVRFGNNTQNAFGGYDGSHIEQAAFDAERQSHDGDERRFLFHECDKLCQCTNRSALQCFLKEEVAAAISRDG